MRYLPLDGWVCLVALEWCRARQPRCVEHMSDKTNVALVSASLHKEMSATPCTGVLKQKGDSKGLGGAAVSPFDVL